MTLAASKPRLHPSMQGSIDTSQVAWPRAGRESRLPGIVHLGLGAFMRAHLAVATETAFGADGDARWGIVGVSLQRPDTRDALGPQDGLYTVAQRGPALASMAGQTQAQATKPYQVIGSVLRVLVAPEAPTAVVEAIAADDTRILSLTVTEKGYTHDPASGRLKLEHPDIVHDLANPQSPRSAIGLIVRGLARRRVAGRQGLTLLSLDNLASNGHVLRGAVLTFAQQVEPAEPGLATWIDAHCSFPCSMVDRIVPATTDVDRARVADALGLNDRWPVCAEPFFSWAVEDHFVRGRPAWQHQAGVHLVRDAKPWETLKLRMVNGCHSVMTYCGLLAGWPTVDAAIHNPEMRTFIEALMKDEIEPTLPAIEGVSLAAYRHELIERWLNPDIGHKLSQIAMDGSQKIPPRWVAPMVERLAQGESIEGLALGVAAWLQFLGACNERGERYLIQDPLAEPLQALHAQALKQHDPVARARTMLGFEPVFGALATQPTAVEVVAKHWSRMRAQGVQASLSLALGEWASHHQGHAS